MSPRIFWQTGNKVNLVEIDRQHQNLIRIVRDLDTAVSARRGDQIIGAILAELVTYTLYHFAAEEDLMQQNGFPGFSAHRIEHHALTLKICGFQEAHEGGKTWVAEELLKYMHEWLEEHMLKRDKEYVQFLNAKGAA
jgi:hemerythrin